MEKITKNENLEKKIADFGLEIEAHLAYLGEHDVGSEKSFSKWGHNYNSNNRSQSYDQIIRHVFTIVPTKKISRTLAIFEPICQLVVS